MLPSVPPPPPPPPAARAGWVALIVITAIDLVVAPFYLLMAGFSAHAMAFTEGPSGEGLFVLAMAAASLVCPITAWIMQLAGGGRRVVYALALVPLALPVLGSVIGTGSSGLIVTTFAK